MLLLLNAFAPPRWQPSPTTPRVVNARVEKDFERKKRRDEDEFMVLVGTILAARYGRTNKN